MQLRIQELIRARGTTQEAVAEKAGLSPSYLSQIAKGRRSPALDVLERIARALNVRLLDLIEWGPDESGLSDVTKSWPYLAAETQQSLRTLALAGRRISLPVSPDEESHDASRRRNAPGRK